MALQLRSRLTDQLWVADVGQDAREEVDTPIVNGGNYGWRVYEGIACTGNDPSLCNPANYLPPIFDYAHTDGRCSITGGYVYRGTRRARCRAGTYVYGDYCTGEIFAWDGAAQRVLLDTTMSISSFGEDEQGELYVVESRREREPDWTSDLVHVLALAVRTTRRRRRRSKRAPRRG